MNQNIYKYYAKKSKDKWLPIHIHSMDVAEVAVNLFYSHNLNKLFTDREFKTIKLLAYLHDIGKITQSFQDKIVNGNKQNVHHSAGSEAILLKYGFDQISASIVGAHHGKPQVDGFYPEMYYAATNCENNVLTDDQISFIESGFEYAELKSIRSMVRIPITTMNLVAGLICEADWIASNDEWFRLIDEGSWRMSKEEHIERVKEGWRKVDFPKGWRPTIDKMSQKIFENTFGFHPNNFQRRCYKVANEVENPGIIIIEDQMGNGKTESAFACAEVLAKKFGCTGATFLLPTKSTTDSMFKRVADWLDSQSDKTPHSISLSHSDALNNKDYIDIMSDRRDNSGLVSKAFFNRAKTDVLANFSVCTIDKLLTAGCKTKHYMMKHLGLANKVVVIDECHAYDEYMNVYLDNVLSWLGHYHTPVIILSATLPQARRRALVKAYDSEHNIKWSKDDNDVKIRSKQYPLVTWTDGDKLFVKTMCKEARKKDRLIKVKKISKFEIVEEVKKLLVNGGCAGIIVNTVAQAQILYMMFRKAFDGAKKEDKYYVELIHSRFTDADRRRKEEYVIEHFGKDSGREVRYRRVIIGTQVLEQSLDIDFDVMFTEMCPGDLFVQRAGRLHRHDRYRPECLKEPNLYILKSNYDDNPIYPKWLMHSTSMQIGGVLRFPSQIPSIVRRTYCLAKREKRDYNNYLKKETDNLRYLNEKNCQMYEEYLNLLEDKRRRAEPFRISRANELSPKYDSLDGMLDYTPDDNGENHVRDGMYAITVYLVRNNGNNLLRWAGKDYRRKMSSDGTYIMREYAEALLKQRVNLPEYFNRHREEALAEIDATIDKREANLFKQNSLLRGLHFLSLDKNNCAEICGKKLMYDKNMGLVELDKVTVKLQ